MTVPWLSRPFLPFSLVYRENAEAVPSLVLLLCWSEII